MNGIFIALVTISLSIIAFSNPEKALESMINGSYGGVTFAIKMYAIYAVWMSILTLWKKIGFDKFLSSKIQPILRKIFPKESQEVYDDLSINLGANILGMGSAGTPAGIRATQGFSSHKNRTLLLVINSTGVQLVPTTIVAMRADLGAKIDVILPTLIATIISTTVGVVLTKIFIKE